jgi:hypothetical protein
MMIAFSLTNRLRLGQAKGGLGFKFKPVIARSVCRDDPGTARQGR